MKDKRILVPFLALNAFYLVGGLTGLAFILTGNFPAPRPQTFIALIGCVFATLMGGFSLSGYVSDAIRWLAK